MKMIDRAEVVQTKARNPCATLQQIGDKYGVTRERVRQILEPYNMPTGLSIRVAFKRKCPECGGIKLAESRVCPKCHEHIHYIPLVCDYCGGLFYRQRGKVLARLGKRQYNHVFCGRPCQGKWWAENHGFIKYPENRWQSRS